MDVCNDIILVNRRNYLTPDRLAICKLPPKESEVPLTWTELTTSAIAPHVEDIYTYEYLDLVQEGNDSVSKLTIFFFFFNLLKSNFRNILRNLFGT